MRERELEARLSRVLGRETTPRRLDETAELCRRIVEEETGPAEPGLGFWGFLSGVFRFEWASIGACQAAALLLVGLFLYGAPKELKYIPVYVPLFVLAVVPVLFRGQYCGTGELEAATRASGAQLALARLILSGAANLVCMTALLWLEVRLTGRSRELGRMILYCLVPYLAGMTLLLRLIRGRKKDAIGQCAAMALGSCLFWRASSHVAPGLYELSAVGVWIAACAVFGAFFTREICFLVKADKEGKMYGTVV